MKINAIYQGENSAAIVALGDNYSVEVQMDEPALTNQLQGSQIGFGSRFRIVKRYDGVNPQSFSVLQEVARSLQAGKEVNLDRLLE